MDETEAIGIAYARVRLAGIGLDVEGLDTVGSVEAYASLRGALLHRDAPVPMDTVDQRVVQRLVRDRLAPDMALAPFIASTVGCRITRAQRTLRLARFARRWLPA